MKKLLLLMVAFYLLATPRVALSLCGLDPLTTCTYTQTATNTATRTPTATGSMTPTPTSTATATKTATQTATGSPTATSTATPTVGAVIVPSQTNADVIVNNLVWDEQGVSHVPSKKIVAQQFFDRTTIIAGTTDRKTRVCWMVFTAISATNSVWFESTSGTRLSGDIELGSQGFFPFFPSGSFPVFETNFGEGIVLRVLNGTVVGSVDISYFTK